MEKIKKLANKFLIDDENLIPWNKFYKLKNDWLEKKQIKGKLILLTSINPTSSGEGKTTIAIGIADALNKLNKQVILALREPTIGPVFGMKGTATGGGEATLDDSWDINLNFTGDMYAIEAANNLVSSFIDNHLYWKSDLNIDENHVYWRRTSNLNERSLRDIELTVSKLIKRHESYSITAACNIMTIISLSKDKLDFKNRLNNCIIAKNKKGEFIRLKSLNITDSILNLMNDVFKVNLASTKHGSLAMIHCGPFANISIGTNSVIATKAALKISDYVVTECGFGSDLGFEKYLDIISYQNSDIIPSCAIIVVTIKALEEHNDFENNFKLLKSHIFNVDLYKINKIISINKFDNDDEKKIKYLIQWLEENKIPYSICTSFKDGPDGIIDLAQKVLTLIPKKPKVNHLLNKKDSISQKIEKICQNIYKCKEVIYNDGVLDKINEFSNNNEFNEFSVCIVKNPSTLSGEKQNFIDKIMIKKIELNVGGQFFNVFINDTFLMPGLGKKSNATKIKYIM